MRLQNVISQFIRSFEFKPRIAFSSWIKRPLQFHITTWHYEGVNNSSTRSDNHSNYHSNIQRRRLNDISLRLAFFSDSIYERFNVYFFFFAVTSIEANFLHLHNFTGFLFYVLTTFTVFSPLFIHNF